MTIRSLFYLLIFTALNTCLSLPLDAQYILAGQTNGEDVYYFNIEDITIYGEPNGSGIPAYFDIDGEGNDIKFWGWWEPTPTDLWRGSEVTPYNNTRISTLVDNYDWIQKHEIGDTIGPNLNWYDDVSLLHCSSSGHSGVFTGEGYLGFNITNPYPMYGWFRINVHYDVVTIFEYAFYSDTYVGEVDKAKEKFRIKFQNPIKTNLQVSLESKNESHHFIYQVLDDQGVIIAYGNLDSGINIIEMREECNGIFLLVVTDHKGFFSSFKIIKQ